MVLSFLIAGILMSELEKMDYKKPEEGKFHLHVYNTLDCDFYLNSTIFGGIPPVIEKYSYKKFKINLNDDDIMDYTFKCGDYKGQGILKDVIEQTSIGIYPQFDNKMVQFDDDLTKSADASPFVRYLFRIEDEFLLNFCYFLQNSKCQQ